MTLTAFVNAHVVPVAAEPFDGALLVEDGRITRIFAMRNPHKLGRLDEVAELRTRAAQQRDAPGLPDSVLPGIGS